MPRSATIPFERLAADAGTAAGKGHLSRMLSAIEAQPEAPEIFALLDRAWSEPAADQARVVGLTGPPGVGKSTLSGALIRRWRQDGRTVGVIAVDPSSRRTGGALLGDRTRLATDPEDAGLFVRSMAARERLGGLADLTMPGVILFRGLFDIVLVETVGVGQSEADVAEVADTVVLCLQPGSGDALQFMKAGIVEIPDIVVVNKADLGDLAARTRTDIEAALDLGTADRAVTVIAASGQSGQGVGELVEAIDRHGRELRAGGGLAERRRDQAVGWMTDMIRARHGSAGLARTGPLHLPDGTSPFAVLRDALDALGTR